MDSIDIFREKLLRITQAKNPRQSKIADDCQISRSEMNDFLHGRKNLSIPRLEKIAAYLGATFAEMISNIDERSDSSLLSAVQEPPSKKNVIYLPHSEIISEFKDKERAREVNLSLLNIERLAPDVFEKLVAHIKSVEWGLRMVAEKEVPYGSGRSDPIGEERRKGKHPEKIPGGIDRRSEKDHRNLGS